MWEIMFRPHVLGSIVFMTLMHLCLFLLSMIYPGILYTFIYGRKFILTFTTYVLILPDESIWQFGFLGIIIGSSDLAKHNDSDLLYKLILERLVCLDIHFLIPAFRDSPHLVYWMYFKYACIYLYLSVLFYFIRYYEFCLFVFWFSFLTLGLYHFTYICLTDRRYPDIHGQ